MLPANVPGWEPLNLHDRGHDFQWDVSVLYRSSTTSREGIYVRAYMTLSAQAFDHRHP